MTTRDIGTVTGADRRILRDLARRKREIATDPVNLDRRRHWTDLHGLKDAPPMVLAEWAGIMDKRKPFAPELKCAGEWAREVETGLRQEIWVFEELRDDHVVEPVHNLAWDVAVSDYGVQSVQHQPPGDHLTARRWDPPITDIARDFSRLHPRTFTVDREKTEARKAALEELFDGIMPVRIRGGFWWTMGMTIVAIDLIGLEPLMLFMYDDPEGLHRLMRFLCDDHLALARGLEKEGLLTLNNENDYIGSGSVGYAPDLPPPDLRAGAAVRTRDLWGLLESQETVGVGPELFEEFVFRYQREIAPLFGLVYYGCCEPVHTRWHVLRKLPNLRAVSVAPLCRQEAMAEALGSEYVFSRKPNPTLISTPRFDEDLIRADFRATLALAGKHGCRLELIMKDVHTLANEPRRLARWVEIAREEIAARW